LAGSLIAAATLGPLLIGLLAANAASTDTSALLGRFALVVLLPLAAGVAARSAFPRIARGEPWYAAGSTLAVAALIYAALSGTSAADHLAPALAAGTAFLALSAIPAIAAAHLVSPARHSAVGFAVALRDFAVAATLATQAFGTSAAIVPGIYGVLMLIAGALTATALRRTAGGTRGPREGADDRA
jgi:BASS family bile acid:Na+ symporter